MHSPTFPRRFPVAGKAAAFAAAYAALVIAGDRLSPIPGGMPVFRPGPGFLLAGLLLCPPAWRARLFAACMAAGLAAGPVSGKGLPAWAGAWCADLAGTWLALRLALRVPGGAAFLGNPAGTVRYFIRVIPPAAGTAAFLQTAAAALFADGEWLRPLAAVFLAEAAGMAVIVPAALAWAHRDRTRRARAARRARFALCAALGLLVGFLTDSQPVWIQTAVGRPLPYATFPFLLWAALDIGPLGAAGLHLALYLLGAGLDAAGHGPYLLGQKMGMGVVFPLQWFPYVAGFCALSLAVLLQRQKRIEAELRLRESRYGKLWTSKLIGIYVFDLRNTIIEANDTFLGMMGLDRAELERKGIDMAAMTTPEHLAAMPRHVEKFLVDGHFGPFEREWVLRDGRRLLGLVYAARMDEPDRALGMVMDVRELDRARKELRLRDSRYRGLLSSTILGVFVTTVDGRILEANDTFLAMIRRSREDLEAGRIESQAMATPEYFSGAQERRRQFEAEGRMGPFDREWVLPDGSRLNTLFFATKLENGDALCMVFDTNELKRTKMELRAVESRFKKLLDANILGVAVVNEDLVVEEANDAFLSMSGYSRAELDSGAFLASALAATRPREENQASRRILQEQGGIGPQETVWTRKDGVPITVYRGVTRLDESNRWLTVALDLSELKRVQAELESAKAVAEAASTAKSEFLAHMSHEIRTPLNGVLGMLALLLDSRLEPEQAGYARAARDSGTHLLALINQILDFSKIERGHVELVHEPFGLGKVIEETMGAVAEAARKKGIALSKQVDPALPARLAGDAMRLRQILLNLLGNAVKFSAGGAIALTVRLHDRRGDRCRIGFEVSDQGPGIPPEAMAKLFQPFRQGDDSMARAAGGTGLGLAISRELTRRMGGEIEVESEVGKGSRFRFHIEAEALGAEDGARDGTAAESQEPGFAPGGPIWSRPPRVLIADDHPVNVNVASIMIRKLGCEVDACADGASALAAAAARGYDLVFMDCQMPVLDGFETTRRLRARETQAAAERGDAPGRVPVIALTAHAVSGMREKCLAAGMDDYLSKPFAREDLEAMIRKWIPAAALPAADPLLDPARLSALDDGTPKGKENTRRLVELFLETGRQSLERIRSEAEAGDMQALAKSLHRLKGSCATVGTVAMAAKLKDMEARLKLDGMTGMAGEVAALESLFERTVAALANLPAHAPR